MATVILLKRASGKGHLTSLLEGTDDAAISSIQRTNSNTDTLASLWTDAITTGITIGGSAQTTGSLFDGAAMTAATIGAGMGAGDNITLGGSSSTVTVSGDLVVNGTTTSVDSEVVNIADNHLYLNKDYTTTSAQTGGLVVNYLPTATGDTSTTGGFATTTTVNTVGAATFPVGAFVQISGAATAANDGLYEVLTHAANVLTIDATPTHSFAQTALTVDATDTTAVITQVTVSAIQAGTDGVWETGAGSTAGTLSFTDLASAAGSTLQTAYDASIAPATITTDATTDGIIITGTAGFQVVATGVDAPNAGFGFEVDTTAAYRLLADAASTVSVTGAGLTLSTVTSGTLLVSAAGLLDINAAASLDIDVTGAYDMLSTGTFSIDGTGISNVTATSGSLTISTLTTGDVNVSAVDSVFIDGAEAIVNAISIQASNAAGGIDVDAGTGGIAVDTTGALSLDSSALASNLSLSATSASAATLTISAANAGAGAGNLDINVDDTLTFDAAGFSVDGTTASNVSTTSAALTISTITAGDLNLTAAASAVITGAESVADAIQITASDAAGGVDINAGTGGVAVDTTGPLSLDSTGTAANLTLSTTAAGAATLVITATNAGAGTGVLDINADDTITIDTAAFSVDGTLASNVSVLSSDAAAQNLTLEVANAGAGDGTIVFDGNGMTVALPLNGVTSGDTGNQDLSSGFTATTLVGALNELKEGGAQGVVLSDNYTTTGRTIGEAVIGDGNDSAATTADASALSTSEGFIGLVTIVGGVGVGEVCTHGTVPALFENGISTPAPGDPIYISEVAGRVTGIAPTGTPNSGIVVYQIGVLRDATGLTAVTTGTDEVAELLVQPVQLFEI